MAGNHRWSKFWWQDWRNDPALALCSVAARGLWMDMLCIMATAEKHGYLMCNGGLMNVYQLSSIARLRHDYTSRLLQELERNGVFSRDDNGVIFCRRMVRDQHASDIGRENGRKGGNPNLKRQSNGHDNPPGQEEGLTPDPTPPFNFQEDRSRRRLRPPLGPPLERGGRGEGHFSKRLPGFVGMVVDLRQRRQQ